MNMNLFTIITTLISLVISLISVISSKPTIHQQINTNIYVESPQNSTPPLLENPNEIVLHNTSFVKKFLYYSIYFSIVGIAIGSFMYRVFSFSKPTHFGVSLLFEASFVYETARYKSTYFNRYNLIDLQFYVCDKFYRIGFLHCLSSICHKRINWIHFFSHFQYTFLGRKM